MTLCKADNFKIGLNIKIRPSINLDRFGQVNYKKCNAVIAYINRKHRYFTAEFKFDSGGSFRESFKYQNEDGLINVITLE